MFLTEHFTLDELTVSQTAARRGLDNTPPDDLLPNLVRLAGILEIVRAKLAAPILISSGYRSPALNALIGGSPTSAHLLGLAADFTAPRFGPPLAVAKMLAPLDLPYDQIIHEYGRWVHLGLAQHPRRQRLSIFAGTGYLPGLRPAP